MKKDYSQPFKPEPHNVFLLIENQKTHQFALWHPSDRDGCVKYRVPRIDMRIRADVPLTLIKAAREYGISLERFSEVDRETILMYSFVDKTRGTKLDVVCMHLMGYEIEGAEPDEGLIFVDIHEMANLLKDELGVSDFVYKTIKRLAADYG